MILFSLPFSFSFAQGSLTTNYDEDWDFWRVELKNVRGEFRTYYDEDWDGKYVFDNTMYITIFTVFNI